jgi:hypothetical protein
MKTWKELPHPFTANGPICQTCGGYGIVHDGADGFAARCADCDRTGEAQ